MRFCLHVGMNVEYGHQSYLLGSLSFIVYVILDIHLILLSFFLQDQTENRFNLDLHKRMLLMYMLLVDVQYNS